MEGTGDCELEVMAEGPARVEEPVHNNMVGLPSGILYDRVSCRCIMHLSPGMQLTIMCGVVYYGATRKSSKFKSSLLL